MSPYFVPAAGLLIVALVLWLCRTTVQPLVRNVVSGLAQNAGSNAGAYGMAALFGVSACMSAFWDVFGELTRDKMEALSLHQYLALWAKVLNPFVVAVLAYCQKSAFKPANPTVPTQ